MLRSVYWWLVTDVSGKPIGSIFTGQEVQEDCLILENRTDGLSRNVDNYQSTLRNIKED